MGVIIRVGGEEKLASLLQSKEVLDNFDSYNFIVVSDQIRIKDVDKKGGSKRKNITMFKGLLPPMTVSAIKVNGTFEDYADAYINYIQDNLVDSIISIIVRSVIKNDINVVFVCSLDEEKSWGYLKLLCEYIQAAYKIPTYTVKKFLKDPTKAATIDNIDEITKIVDKKIKKYADELNFNPDETIGGNKSKTKVSKKEIKEMGRKKLIKFAADNGIEINEDAPKEKIIKKILKKTS